MVFRSAFMRNYSFSVILFVSMVVGSVLGILFKEQAALFKPFGDVFLNLLFTIVVPLVFFSISSAVAGISHAGRLTKILVIMLAVFVVTGVIASIVMIAGVQAFPPAEGLKINTVLPPQNVNMKLSEQIVSAFTVSDFRDLFSRQSMLALIIFAMLTGFASSHIGDKGMAFRQFLSSGNEVMMKLIAIVMLYAPIGLGAYFAYLVGVFGHELLGSYLRAMALYYPVSFLYFFAAFTLYAYIAGGRQALHRFWVNIVPTSLTALATGSSVASIPSNLEAARKIGVPEDVRDVVIPIGSTIHMDGSCLSAILKIAVLFGLYGQNFSDSATILTAIGIALLSGTVMSGIPGGGFIGEMMIVALYGFPPEALPIISMIGTLVDPPATMVNAVGDNVSSMLVARFVDGKEWMVDHADN